MPGDLGQRQAHWRGVQAGLAPIRRRQARLVAYPGEAVYEFADGATWRSGYATVCKTVYSGSIPDVASTFEINDLGPPFQHWFSGRGMAPRTPRGNRSYGVPTTVVQCSGSFSLNHEILRSCVI